tara:strand:- start:585 stop:941 length:357 start_codon:yes stop_codon:yes gene_type:complete
MTTNSGVGEATLLPQVSGLPLTDFVRGKEPDFVVGESVDLGRVTDALFSDRETRHGREVIVIRGQPGGTGIFGGSIDRDFQQRKVITPDDSTEYMQKNKVVYSVNGNNLQPGDELYFR